MRNSCLLVAVITIAVSICTSCGGGSGMNQDTSPSAPTTAPKAFDEAMPVGTWATCPDCGMVLKIAADTPSVQYHGKYYYFCSGMCKDHFDADPTSYKVAAPKAFDHAMPDGTWATCPVCPSGMEFQIDSTRPMTEYNGKFYYFCKAMCQENFNANPESYITE